MPAVIFISHKNTLNICVQHELGVWVIVTSIKKVLIILNIVVSNRYLVWVLDISVYPRILFTSVMFDLV